MLVQVEEKQAWQRCAMAMVDSKTGNTARAPIAHSLPFRRSPVRKRLAGTEVPGLNRRLS